MSSSPIFIIVLAMLAWFAMGTTPAAAETLVAVWLSHDGPAYQQALEGFRTRLTDYDDHATYGTWTVDREDRLAEARAHLEKNPPRLILALGAIAIRAASSAHRSVPVVATLIFDVDELKDVTNATGVTLEFPMELQWRWFRRLLPQAKRLGVLYDPALGQGRYRELERLAGAGGVGLSSVEVSAPESLPDALKSLPSNLDALWALGEPRLFSPQTAKEILLYSFRNRVPFVGLSDSWVKAGSLYALDRDYTDMGQQCADMAGAILKGTPASKIPPAVPRKLRYSLNLNTAEHMKLEFPDDVVRDANEVFR